MSNRVFPEGMGKTQCQLLQIILVEYEVEIVYTLSCGNDELEGSSGILTSSLRIVMERKNWQQWLYVIILTFIFL